MKSRVTGTNRSGLSDTPIDDSRAISALAMMRQLTQARFTHNLEVMCTVDFVVIFTRAPQSVPSTIRTSSTGPSNWRRARKSEQND